MKIRVPDLPLVGAGVTRALAFRESRIAKKARRNRAQRNAVFIGVTGSSTKSTTTALLAHILAAIDPVQSQYGANVYGTLKRTLARMPRRARFVVVECAAGPRRGIRAMADILRPDVAIVTLVALEHKSVFQSVEAVAAEKSDLVAAIAPGGLALLNADDPLVLAMRERTRERVVTFGTGETADYRAVDIDAAFPVRLSFTALHPAGRIVLRTNFVGVQFWLPALAAFAAALELGVSPELAAARIATFEPLATAAGVLSVPGGPQFIVDATKAPWHSMPLAFDILARVSARRRRVVLGHMSDFAGSSEKYPKAYKMARAVADEVIFVGDHAHRSRASAKDREDGRFRQFATPREAADYIAATAVPDEVILIKGSVDLHLERLALSMREEVRCWVPRCGKRQGCLACRRYGDPFEWHKGRKKRIRVKRALKWLLAKAARGRRPEPTATLGRES